MPEPDRTAAAPAPVASTPPMGVGRLGLAWRAAAMLLALAILTAGQLRHTDDYFPLGAEAMFAQPRDPDGTVDSTCLEGTDAGGGRPHPIPFGARSVGVSRADVEGHLRALTADPSGLQTLATAYARRHPNAPPLISISLCTDRYRLRHGAPDGPPQHLVLATWAPR